MINTIESNKCIELQSKCNYLKHFSFSKVTPTVNRVTLVQHWLIKIIQGSVNILNNFISL